MANTVNLVLPDTGLTISQWTGNVSVISGTTSVAINCNVANAFYVQFTGSATTHTFTVSNLAVGQTIKITTVQPASGTLGTITWAGQTISWAGGTTGDATQTHSKSDTFTLYAPASGVIGGAVALPNF